MPLKRKSQSRDDKQQPNEIENKLFSFKHSRRETVDETAAINIKHSDE